MNYGIIEKTNLEKDIEQIGFYTEEEDSKLEEINDTFKESLGCYTSTNSYLFSNALNENTINTKILNRNRLEYAATLNRVIIKYVNDARKVSEYFEKGDLNEKL